MGMSKVRKCSFYISVAFFVLFRLANGEEILLRDDFETAQIAPVWQLTIGAKDSFAKIEPRNGGNCLHLFGDHSTTSVASIKSIPNMAYTLEFDFFQPSTEVGGYQAVIHHPRPQGHSYWWLEYGPERFFLYTISGGIWFNRWQAFGIPSGKWLHIQIRNTPKSVSVKIYDETGKRLLAGSPSIPHDDGDPAPITFSAVGTQKGSWGMKIDNVLLYITPVFERPDYILRKDSLKLIRSALLAEEVKNMWQDVAEELKKLEEALQRASSVAPSDWQGYVEAIKAFDFCSKRVGEQYYEKVASKIGKERNGWVMLDIWKHFNADALSLGIQFPFSKPISEVEGIPFATMPFGKNCLWQDVPSRSRYAIPVNAKAKFIALLLAFDYDEKLYSRDDSLIDVLQVELQYADGFRERIFPTPVNWQPLLPYGVGKPPLPNRVVTAYMLQPSHNSPISQIVFCDGAIQAGWAIFSVSYKLGSPLPIATPEAKKVESKKITPVPARLFHSDKGTSLKNSYFCITFDNKVGAIKELNSPLCGKLITEKNPSPLFAIQKEDGEVLYSDYFALKSQKARQLKDGIAINLVYAHEKLKGIEVSVNIQAGKSGTMEWQIELRNNSDKALKIRPIFPLLDGLYLGDKVGWFFPQRGGAVSELPIEGLASYGGMAWLQLLDIFRQEGGGIYIRCDDTEGLYKIFALRWNPSEDASPRRVADIPKPVHPVAPWRSKVGVHLSIQFLPQEISPKMSWLSPQATISIHEGDWHKAIADYKNWLKTWWKPIRPCPERFKYGFYALVGGAPAEGQKGEKFGSYDWWHLSPFWTIDYPSELKDELDELKRQAERAKKWGQAVGVYIEGMVLEKKRKIAKEFGDKWAMMDDEGNYYSYYSTEANPVWNICPAVKEWQKWVAWAYSEIARKVPLCAMYVDSLGSRWAEVCYNPAHKHQTPGIWVRGCAELFEAIRQEVMKVNNEIAIHSEEPGSDYMALHLDGSWSHSLWTNISGDPEYNPAGINYFRFVLPQFKMYEIPSYQHALWRCKLAFFNGEGLWTNQPDALRQELFIRWMPTLRENADIFLSEDVDPALPMLSPPLYINRFRKGEQTIYTIYNAGLRTQNAKLYLKLPKNFHVFDLINLREIEVKFDKNLAFVDISVDPHDVLCIFVTPKVMNVKVEGKKLRITLSGAKAKELWLAKVDESGVRQNLKKFSVSGKEFEIDIDEISPNLDGCLLVRLAFPRFTEDIAVVKLPAGK